MRCANIYMQGVYAGILTEDTPEAYEFAYASDYDGPPISLTMPVRSGPYRFKVFPSVFEGLLPEGVMLEGLLRQCKVEYLEVPENEDVTMRMAALANIKVPLHGLLYTKDGDFCYFIKRFDRVGRSRKLAVEDFAQLTGRNQETKYDASMEQVAGVIDRFCTFPAVECVKARRPDRLLWP